MQWMSGYQGSRASQKSEVSVSNNKYTSLLLILLFGVGACSASQSTKAEQGSVRRDSADIVIVENHVVPDDTDALRLGELTISIGEAEGEAGRLLSRVGGATRLQGGRVALSDNGSSSIRIYDRSGDLVHSFGNRGEGPREFVGVLGPWKVSTGSARLAAYDFRGQRVTALTERGEFVDVHPLRPQSATPPRVAGFLDDLSVIQVERAWDEKPGELTPVIAHVIAAGPPDWTRDTIYSAPTNRRGFVTTEAGRRVMSGPHFEPSFSAAASGSLVVVSDCASPEFKVLDRNGVIRQIVRWRSGDRTVSDEDVTALYEEAMSGLPLERSKLVEDQLNASPVARTFPACDIAHPLLGDALRISAEGNVWVREYIRPSDSEQIWLRFEDGQLRHRLALEKTVAVQEFGRDYVLVIERDELGVERLREYRLRLAVGV